MPTNDSCFINSDLFFLIKEGKIVAWNYDTHEQYELEKDYFHRLLDISSGLSRVTRDIDNELLQTEFVTKYKIEKVWGWDILSRIFHIGTKINESHLSEDILNDPESFVSESIAVAKESLPTSPAMVTEKHGDLVMLPVPDLLQLDRVNFLTVLSNRKTSRTFDGSSVSLNLLSTILFTVFGNFHTESNDYTQHGFRKVGLRKTSPSAGGLHASEGYVLALCVEGLKPGVYHYQAHNHCMTLVNDANEMKLTTLLCGQYFAEQLSFGIFITSRFEKIWHKYPHSRAYRVALLDAGHLSQTFQLVATALGLNTWLSGVFLDKAVSKLLAIEENESEQPLFFVGAGYGDGSPLDPVAKKRGQIK